LPLTGQRKVRARNHSHVAFCPPSVPGGLSGDFTLRVAQFFAKARRLQIITNLPPFPPPSLSLLEPFGPSDLRTRVCVGPCWRAGSQPPRVQLFPFSPSFRLPFLLACVRSADTPQSTILERSAKRFRPFITRASSSLFF